MSRFLLSLVFLTAVALVPSPAEAFVDPPTLVPERPMAGEPVYVQIRAGKCDDFVVDVPGYPQLTVVGNSVHLVLTSTHADDPLWCFLPVDTSLWPIGSFGPGDYLVQVDRHVEVQFGDEYTEQLGVLRFSTSTAAQVPTAGGVALLLLAIGMVAAVGWSRRRATNTATPSKACSPLRWAFASLLAWSQGAAAFVDPPTVTPRHALTGEVIAVQVRAGQCDGFYVDPNYPVITGNGLDLPLTASQELTRSCAYSKRREFYRNGAHAVDQPAHLGDVGADR